MPRKCTICENEARHKIDKSLSVGGMSLRAIARQFNVGRDALRRHVNGGHIARKISEAVKAHEVVEADALLDEILDIEKTTKDIIKECRTKSPDNRLALKAIERREKQIELKGRVLGSFKEKPPGGGGVLEKTIIILPSNDRDTKKSK
jgi:transposase-like protein